MKIEAKHLKLAAVAAVAIVALYFIGSYLTGGFGAVQPGEGGKYDKLAKCLTQKGAVMYGASWCSHCAEQKALFGDSFQYVTYVECAEGSGQAQACKDAGVTAYPAWKINGQLSYGAKPLDELARLAGCEI
jgi:glutaredoxin